MKSRFVFYVLLAACLPALLAFWVTTQVAPEARAGLESRANAASAAVLGRLDADAGERRDLLLRLSLLPTVSGAVREASAAGAAPPAEAVERMRDAAREIIPDHVPELFALGTVAGVRYVVTNGEVADRPAADFPLAPAALAGQTAGVLSMLDGALYRFYALPVGVAEGAVIVGDRYAEATAMRLRDAARAHVTFVSGGKAVVSSLPAEERAAAAGTAAHPGALQREGRLGLRIALLRPLDAVFPLMAPEARWVSLSRPLDGIGVVVTIATEPEFGWLPRAQALGLGLALAALLLGLVWIPILFDPYRRQARSIEAHLARLRAEPGARLGTRGFTVPFLGLVRMLDEMAEELTDAVPRAPRPRSDGTGPTSRVTARRPEVLPLGGTPGEALAGEGTPAAFPFADDPAAKAQEPAASQSEAPQEETPPVPAPESSRAEPSPAPDAEPPMAVTMSMMRPIGLELAGAAAKAAAPAPSPAPAGDDAVLPPELARRASELEAEMLGVPSDPDEAHHRAVYEEFVATRQKCGEGAQNVPYEKFVERLRRNREQLVAKFNCRGVRFQVYVKDGKAAIKAAPVR